LSPTFASWPLTKRKENKPVCHDGKWLIPQRNEAEVCDVSLVSQEKVSCTHPASGFALHNSQQLSTPRSQTDLARLPKG
jgi:hypothetical protein